MGRKQFFPIEAEFGDDEGWGTYSEVGRYLVNRGASIDYRDAGRSEDRDDFKVMAKTNSNQKVQWKSERSIKRFIAQLSGYGNTYGSYRMVEFEITTI